MIDSEKNSVYVYIEISSMKTKRNESSHKLAICSAVNQVEVNKISETKCYAVIEGRDRSKSGWYLVIQYRHEHTYCI